MSSVEAGVAAPTAIASGVAAASSAGSFHSSSWAAGGGHRDAPPVSPSVSAALSSGGGGAADSAAAAALAEDLRKELAVTRAALSAAQGALQTKVPALEFSLAEARAIVLATAHAAHDFEAKVAALTDAQAKESVELHSRIAQLTERLRVAPMVDRLLQSLYVELRSHGADRLGLPALQEAERERIARSSSLVVADAVRTWVRLVAGQAAGVYQEALTAGVHPFSSFAAVGPAPPPPPAASLQQPPSPAGRQQSLPLAHAPHLASPRLLSGTSASIAAFASFRSLPLARAGGGGGGGASAITAKSVELEEALTAATTERDTLKERLERLEMEMALNKQSDDECAHHSRLMADIARRDATIAKHENRQKQQIIEQLQKRLGTAQHVAVGLQRLARAEQEAEGAKKNMKIAVQAKQQELDLVKRQHAETLKEQHQKIEQLVRQQVDAQGAHAAATDAKREASSAKAQLARVNVKGLIDEKRRAQQLTTKQEGRIRVLEGEVDAKEAALKYLEQTNEQMTQSYNKLFEAHLQEQARQKAERQRQLTDATAVKVKGPNGELSAEHYREKCRQLMASLGQMQSKMRRLLLVAHNEQLLHERQAEALATERDEAAQAVRAHQARWRDFAHSIATNTDGRSGRSPDPAEIGAVSLDSGGDFLSLLEAQRAAAAREAQARATERVELEIFHTPGIVVGPDETALEVAVRTWGSPTAFGDPFAEAGDVRIRTTMPTRENEASVRSVPNPSDVDPRGVGVSHIVAETRPPTRAALLGESAKRGGKFSLGKFDVAHTATPVAALLSGGKGRGLPQPVARLGVVEGSALTGGGTEMFVSSRRCATPACGAQQQAGSSDSVARQLRPMSAMAAPKAMDALRGH